MDECMDGCVLAYLCLQYPHAVCISGQIYSSHGDHYKNVRIMESTIMLLLPIGRGLRPGGEDLKGSRGRCPPKFEVETTLAYVPPIFRQSTFQYVPTMT